jgi:hypothetical protein
MDSDGNAAALIVGVEVTRLNLRLLTSSPTIYGRRQMPEPTWISNLTSRTVAVCQHLEVAGGFCRGRGGCRDTITPIALKIMSLITDRLISDKVVQ